MISLVTKAAHEAKSRSSKRVTAAHLKQAVVKDERFDFLADIVGKVPDGPAQSNAGKEMGDNSEGGMDVDGGNGGGKKRRGAGGGRKKKRGSDGDE